MALSKGSVMKNLRFWFLHFSARSNMKPRQSFICHKLPLMSARHKQLFLTAHAGAQKPTVCSCFKTKKLLNSHFSIQVLDNGRSLSFYINSILLTHNLMYMHILILANVLALFKIHTVNEHDSIAREISPVQINVYSASLICSGILYLNDPIS